ncbi:MAG: hypothetical protein M3P11_00390 [Actinomycetota bacterium]|nr:hypothetical protein [Actinomycetota bacterium]
MNDSMLAYAFRHHTWANLSVVDACSSLPGERLATPIPAIYGSVLDTLRHIVGADNWYLFVISGRRIARIDEERMSLAELRTAAESYGDAWEPILAEHSDPNLDVAAHRDDGSTSHAPIGIRLAQVVHHGTDHRSQICTALTTLGVEPPEIDLWAYGEAIGTNFETPS